MHCHLRIGWESAMQDRGTSTAVAIAMSVVGAADAQSQPRPGAPASVRIAHREIAEAVETTTASVGTVIASAGSARAPSPPRRAADHATPAGIVDVASRAMAISLGCIHRVLSQPDGVRITAHLATRADCRRCLACSTAAAMRWQRCRTSRTIGQSDRTLASSHVASRGGRAYARRVLHAGTGEVLFWIDVQPAGGGLELCRADGGRGSTAEVVGGRTGDAVAILPNGIRVHNDSLSNATYRSTVPGRRIRVRVRVRRNTIDTLLNVSDIGSQLELRPRGRATLAHAATGTGQAPN